MVDKNVIADIILKCFYMSLFKIDDNDGSVTIYGGGLSIRHNIAPKFSRLPLKFTTCIGDFYLEDWYLTTLEGCPKFIEGNFSCNTNRSIKTLKGGPTEVTGKYICSQTSITSFENGPTKVGSLICSNTKSLTSLEGSPSVRSKVLLVDQQRF
jgi:hypothetical protein